MVSGFGFVFRDSGDIDGNDRLDLDRRCMVYGLWSMVYGQWSPVYGFGFRVAGLPSAMVAMSTGMTALTSIGAGFSFTPVVEGDVAACEVSVNV
jgi:hypothetical protein